MAIPPHMLDNIAASSYGRTASRAAVTRNLTERQRVEREQAMSSTPRRFWPCQWWFRRRQGHGPRRRIYTAGHDRVPSNDQLVRSEGAPPTGDITVGEAYEGFGDIFWYYDEVHDRYSYDDHGAALRGKVHFGRDYMNAFWNGKTVSFGDGDGEIFNRFTIDLSIIGHELTHAVIGDSLRYQYQAGALNEHISDVFGALVVQHVLQRNALQASWLIGADLLTENVQGRAIRDMHNPGTAYDDPVLGTDPQPAHMNDYVNTERDNGGVHINSGIPNRAFVLAAQGAGGYAYETVGKVWYQALSEIRDPAMEFRDFAALTIDIAADHDLEVPVETGWHMVGI